MLRGLTLQVVHHGPIFKIIKLVKKKTLLTSIQYELHFYYMLF
jgi:hypothetical protein